MQPAKLRRPEKLSVRRETIRRLDKADLEQVRGGDSLGDVCTHIVATQPPVPKV